MIIIAIAQIAESKRLYFAMTIATVTYEFNVTNERKSFDDMQQVGLTTKQMWIREEKHETWVY